MQLQQDGGKNQIDAVLTPSSTAARLRAALGFQKGVQEPMSEQAHARAGARTDSCSCMLIMPLCKPPVENAFRSHARKTAQGWAQEARTLGHESLNVHPNEL